MFVSCSMEYVGRTIKLEQSVHKRLVPHVSDDKGTPRKMNGVTKLLLDIIQRRFSLIYYDKLL
ncbi:hypothetical protein D3C73_1419460 [compost metagenome]